MSSKARKRVNKAMREQMNDPRSKRNRFLRSTIPAFLKDYEAEARQIFPDLFEDGKLKTR